MGCINVDDDADDPVMGALGLGKTCGVLERLPA
jgi:hypothetical protein